MTMNLQVRKSVVAIVLTTASGLAFAADDGWQARVGEALGKTGSAAPGGIYRVSLPRTDLKVTLDGVELKPGFAFGGWLAFEKTGDSGMVMGDLVLTMDEVSPVMKKLVEGGIDVTALHNHLLRNQPFTMYMHVLGHGDPVKLAAALHTALAESKTPPAADRSRPRHNGSVARRKRRQQRWCLSVWNPPSRTDPRRRNGCPAGDGLGHCYQFPADARRQGGHHRRLRVGRQRGEPGNEGTARPRDRGHGTPQPHARRRAAPVLHAFLGE